MSALSPVFKKSNRNKGQQKFLKEKMRLNVTIQLQQKHSKHKQSKSKDHLECSIYDK